MSTSVYKPQRLPKSKPRHIIYMFSNSNLVSDTSPLTSSSPRAYWDSDRSLSHCLICTVDRDTFLDSFRILPERRSTLLCIKRIRSTPGAVSFLLARLHFPSSSHRIRDIGCLAHLFPLSPVLLRPPCFPVLASTSKSHPPCRTLLAAPSMTYPWCHSFC